MLKCSHCQSENRNAAQFCFNCGGALTAADFATGVAPSGRDARPAPGPVGAPPQGAAGTVDEKNAAAMQLVAQGRLSEALEALNESIQLAPNHTPSYLNRADVLALLEMLPRAEADRRRAEQLAPPPAYPDPAAAAATFCPSCGQPTAAGAGHCSGCGRFLGPVVYAGFWMRFGALLLDWVIAIALALIPAIIIGSIVSAVTLPADDASITQEEEDTALAAAVWAVFLVWIVIAGLYIWLGNSLGGTWGKRALGLRVLCATNRGNIGLLRGLGRYIVAGIGSIPLYLGWFMMLWDDQKQTWHDKAAGSIVVQKR